MLRNLVNKLSSSLVARRVSPRKKVNVPVKIGFAPVKDGVKRARSWDDAILSGESADLSSSGISFVVPAIRIRDRYLVGQERTLNVELDLAGTKVRMKVCGRRYEKIGIELSEEKYIVGAEIVEIEDDDRGIYENYLADGFKPASKLEAVFD